MKRTRAHDECVTASDSRPRLTKGQGKRGRKCALLRFASPHPHSQNGERRGSSASFCAPLFATQRARTLLHQRSRLSLCRCARRLGCMRHPACCGSGPGKQKQVKLRPTEAAHLSSGRARAQHTPLREREGGVCAVHLYISTHAQPSAHVRGWEMSEECGRGARGPRQPAETRRDTRPIGSANKREKERERVCGKRERGGLHVKARLSRTAKQRGKKRAI